MSLSSAVGASVQCLEALEDLHKIGFLHRDVKPGNFAVGRREKGESGKASEHTARQDGRRSWCLTSGCAASTSTTWAPIGRYEC